LHNRLQPISEARALLARAHWLEKNHPFSLYNRRKQLVGHGEIVEIYNTAGSRFLYAALVAERGHKSELKIWLRRLAELGMVQTSGSAYARFIEISQLNLAGYAPKRIIRLQPHWPVRRALQALLRHQIQVMLQNEAGLRGDWDAEFLHDFRVAIRRTRSLISLFKKVLASDRMQQARQDFAFLSEKTNHLRDLDVQLLHRDTYRKLLPPSLHDGLEVLFKAAARERQKEFNSFIRVLDGVAFRRIKKKWLEFLKHGKPPQHPGQEPSLPIGQLVNRLVLQRLKKLQKMAGAVTEAAQDEELHRLRIEGKKLRYLLEFFSSLYPRPELERILEPLKQMQDHLGTLNDLAVQQARLLRHVREPQARRPHPHMTAAIGALVAVLHQHYLQLRHSLPETISVFFTTENRKRCRNLFSG
jgi:CHAD domain-containing protein